MALLMYTSGTTGVPKGVMLTQANLVANARSISAEHALTPADRVLGVLPLYHINAFAVTMLAPLAHGGSVAVAPKFSAARFWSQAFETQCTWINVVPTIISFLLEGEAPDAALLSTLRFCRSASAALPPEHLLAFERKFGIGIIETMGLTECVAPCFSNPLDPAQRRVGSVGRASGCEARIIDTACMPLPDGQRGEIAIRGPNVMRGYYKNDAATTAAFTPDGWLRSGDLGHRDADGFFFVTGRLKELIIKGGENIAPREIDEVLLAHPAVLDAAAVGMPDKHYGQEVLAAVVLREGMVCSEDELRDFCLQRLGRYKTPKSSASSPNCRAGLRARCSGCGCSTAEGALLPFNGLGHWSFGARPRADRRQGFEFDAPAFGRGPLRCSGPWPRRQLTSRPAGAAFKQSRRSQSTRRAARAGHGPCASRHRIGALTATRRGLGSVVRYPANTRAACDVGGGSIAAAVPSRGGG